VADFVEKAGSIYGYDHFLNDTSGSFCEIDDQQVLEQVARDTLMIYIKADPADEKFLIERAASDPKPLYYREPFLDQQLVDYMQLHELEFTTQIDPADFVRWVFPQLFRARVPRYAAIAETYGYTIAARDAFEVGNCDEFLELIGKALD
jgi:hypothetical protein